jgi:hypothetical protein
MADGFLPDFQAEIKSTHKPRPMEMMTEINKWVCILSALGAVVSMQALDILKFIY